MATVNLPFPELTGNNNADIAILYDTVIKLRKELEFLLSNLDEENVIRAKEVTADWIYANSIEAKQIKAETGKIDIAEIGIVKTSKITFDIPVDYNYLDISREEAFNLLTENCTVQGLFYTTYRDDKGVLREGLFINADYINAGTIKAAYIDTKDLSCERIYHPLNPANYALIGGNYADLMIYKDGVLRYDFRDEHTILDFRIHGDSKTYMPFSFGFSGNSYLNGNWDFSGANISGLSTDSVTHNHGIPDGTRLMLSNESGGSAGYVIYRTHTHSHDFA